MKNIMFEMTPGTDSRTQELIAQLQATGDRLDAATEKIENVWLPYALRSAHLITEAGVQPHKWEKTS